MSDDGLKLIKWYVDTSFLVHPYLKIHTRSIMTMGQVVMQSVYRKQKLNTRISIEAELFAVDDKSVYIFCTVLFIEWKRYKIDKNIFYRDNKSSFCMEVNGKMSAGKRS